MGKARPPVIAGLHFVKRRRPGQPPRWHVYAWRGGPSIHTADQWERPQLPREALEKLARLERGATHGSTIEEALAAWQSSPDFARLAPTTQRQWRYAAATIATAFAGAHMRFFEDARMRRRIFQWRDSRAATPRTADYGVAVLASFLEWARARGMIARNPAADIPQLWQGGKRAAIIWTPEERTQWQAADAPVRDAFNLACLTGLRRGDLLALPFEALTPGAIRWEPSKAGGRETVTVPLYPALRRLIEDIRSRHPTGRGIILRNSRGEPWTPNGFTSRFTEERRKLALPAKRFHDTRGTFATELYAAGFRPDQIAVIMGWSERQVTRIIRSYVDLGAEIVTLSERMQG